MTRPHTHHASLLLLAIAWTTPLYAQIPEMAPATPPIATPPTAVPPTTTPVQTATVVEPDAITAVAQPQATPAAALPATTPPVARWRRRNPMVNHRAAPVEDDSAVTDFSNVRSPFSVMGVVDHRWNTAPSFDLFSDNDVTHFYGVALAYDVISFSDKLNVAMELGWNTGNSHRSDLLGGAISHTTLLTHNVNTAVTARFDLLPWLAPHARLSLGLSVLDMSLTSQGDDRTFADHVVSPFIGLGVGTSIQTPAGALATRNGHFSSLKLGVRFEGGYTLAGSAGFSLHANDNPRVPVTDSSVGGLARSGVYIQTAGFVRF
jgi:hypothetical protein